MKRKDRRQKNISKGYTSTDLNTDTLSLGDSVYFCFNLASSALLTTGPKSIEEKDAWDEEDDSNDYYDVLRMTALKKRKIESNDKMNKDGNDDKIDEGGKINEDGGDGKINENGGDGKINENGGDGKINENGGDGKINENGGDGKINENGDDNKKDKKSEKYLVPLPPEEDINPVMPPNVYFMSDDVIKSWEKKIRAARNLIDEYLLSRIPMIEREKISGMMISCYEYDYLSTVQLEKLVQVLNFKIFCFDGDMGLFDLQVAYSLCNLSRTGYKWRINYYFGHITD